MMMIGGIKSSLVKLILAQINFVYIVWIRIDLNISNLKRFWALNNIKQQLYIW